MRDARRDGLRAASRISCEHEVNDGLGNVDDVKRKSRVLAVLSPGILSGSLEDLVHEGEHDLRVLPRIRLQDDAPLLLVANERQTHPTDTDIPNSVGVTETELPLGL